MLSGPAEQLDPERYRLEVVRQVRRRLTVVLSHTRVSVWLSVDFSPARATVLHVQARPQVVDAIEWHVHVGVPDEPRYHTDQFVEQYADHVVSELVADVSAWN